MSASEVRELRSLGFEIGSHTMDHIYLTRLTTAAANKQVESGKSELEQVLGEFVNGFCYPGGKFHEKHVEMVRASGFIYARTTENLHLDITTDPYRIPVSIQCYPHRKSVYLSNFIRYPKWGRRAGVLGIALSEHTLLTRLKIILDRVCSKGGIFHLWGHSWELDQFNGWKLLDDFFKYVDDRVILENRITNFSVAKLIRNQAEPGM